MEQQAHFKIDSVSARTHDTSEGGYFWKVEVKARVDVKVWKRHRDKGILGQIYNVDIGNHLYRMNKAWSSHCPTVSDSARASKGFKYITLTYYFSDLERAKALGLQVQMYGSKPYPKYGDYVQVYNAMSKLDRRELSVERQLRLVGAK